jgi:small redox-active disulfide protein 2
MGARLIEILGSGCAKCEMLAKHAEEAATALGLDFAIVKVKDPAAIARYGVMQTPALVVDGHVKLAGRVLTAEKLKELIR